MTIVYSRGETPSELKEYHPERVLTVVYAPLSLAIMTIFMCKDIKGDSSKRHLIGYVLFCASSIGLLMLDLATSRKGGMEKYVGICLLVMVSCVADAHVQGGMVGNLAFMCPEFVQSYLAGLSASGALTFVLRLITKAAFKNVESGPTGIWSNGMESYLAGLSASGALTSVLRLITKAAFKNVENGLRKGVFLAISIAFEFQCVFFYAFVFPNLPVVKYYRAKAAREGSETVASSNLSIVGAENGFEQHVKIFFFSILSLNFTTRKTTYSDRTDFVTNSIKIRH
ncbi:equilibrative nucleotide transporter 3-like protein isoform X1 [Tanacetum coccineum]